MEFLFKPIEQTKLVRSKELYDAICVKHNDKLCAEVIIDGKKTIIPFTKDSFDTKGKEKIFTKTADKHGRIICIIRSKDHAIQFPESNEFYTPVRERYKYSGNIVSNGNIKYFDIVETYFKV